MHNYKLDVELSYGTLSEGETLSGEVCPACKGGSQQEKSFSVSRSRGVLLFTCHRASCGIKGVTGSGTDFIKGEARATPRSGRVYVPSTNLDEKVVSFLAKKYRLPESSMELAGMRGVRGDAGVYTGRVCFPIYGPDSRERGANYRSYDGRHPKSLITLDQDALAFSWYVHRRVSRALVLVEDQVSAIRVAPFFHSAALMGVNLSDAKVEEIRKRKYKVVYLCLDNDATGQAVRLALKLRNKLPQLQVIGLDKDIKDMNEEEFQSFLNRLN